MFPAYKTEDLTPAKPKISNEFLQNNSYDSIPVTSSIVAQQISSNSDSESPEEVNSLVHKKSLPDPPETESYYIDRERNKTYLKLDFLCNRAVPFYRIRKNYKNFAQSNRNGSKVSFRRYFKTKRVKKLNKDHERLIDEKVTSDEEMRLYLVKNPQDVDKWMEYIEYKVLINSYVAFHRFVINLTTITYLFLFILGINVNCT